jgi:hypothetical protein
MCSFRPVSRCRRFSSVGRSLTRDRDGSIDASRGRRLLVEELDAAKKPGKARCCKTGHKVSLPADLQRMILEDF